MDPLQVYLTTACYHHKDRIEHFLDKKIIITIDHIKNINFESWHDHCNFNIIMLFEKYGYVFTNDSYIALVNKQGNMLQYIPNDKRTYKICKTAVQRTGLALQYVPINKQTNEIYKTAVRQDGFALGLIPKNKITNEICEIAVQQCGIALKYVPENKKTHKICSIAIQQNKYLQNYDKK